MIEKQKKIFTLVIEEDRGSNMVDIKGIANLLKGFRQNYSGSGHFDSSTPSYAWSKASISCRNALFILRKQ